MHGHRAWPCCATSIPGRRHTDEITVYSPLGLPPQDCVAAWHVYRGATERGWAIGMTGRPDRRWPQTAGCWLPSRHRRPTRARQPHCGPDLNVPKLP
ncbi:MAG: hypothetical protein H0T54_01305 [Geodermatophilaceae bacterium]|nr:hypothetical protein [Geodermatophilaceae bacterium]